MVVEKNKKWKEKGIVTTNTTDIQRSMREYYEQLHTNKSDNLEEMGKFLKTGYYEDWIMDRKSEQNARKEIETLIKASPQTRAQDQIVSLVNFTKHLRKNKYQ